MMSLFPQSINFQTTNKNKKEYKQIEIVCMHVIYCIFHVFVSCSITHNPKRTAKWSFKDSYHAEITLNLLYQIRYIDKNLKLVKWKQKGTTNLLPHNISSKVNEAKT